VSVPARLAIFFCGLVAIAAAAFGLGSIVQPASGTKATSHAMTPVTGIVAASNGLAVSDGEYTLELSRTTFAPGTRRDVRIRVLDPAGRAVKRFDEEAPGIRMHLIVVRRDLEDYQHLHPDLQPDGTLRQSLALPRAGSYRAFADFEIDGEKHVLGADLLAAGSFAPATLAPVSRLAVVDGYRIALSASPHAGAETKMSFHITRGERPVRLDPYVGARGHLVALRVGDLAYSHVHPSDELKPAGELEFMSEFATAGAYRLFLQFNAGGAVHTVPFTFEVAR
jgi:hypothetical protein